MMHAYVYAMQMQCNYGAKHLKCYKLGHDVDNCFGHYGIHAS
jgi:hypothetical protein